MLHFWWKRLSAIWDAAMSVSNRWSNAVVLLVFFLIVFNRRLAKTVSGWHGFSGWYGATWIVAIVIFAIARASYEREVAREERFSRVEERIDQLVSRLDDLPAQSGGVTGVHFGDQAAGNTVGNMLMQVGTGELPTIDRQPSLDRAALGARCQKASDAILELLRRRLTNDEPPSFAPTEERDKAFEARRAHDEETFRLFVTEYGREVGFLAEELVLADEVSASELRELDARMSMMIGEVAQRLGVIALRIETTT